MVDISVLIPVYNVENYLARCLDSVLEQDFSGTFEVICVNDGSDDKSGDILQQYAQRYPNIRIINQENQGLAAARNVSVSEAKGEYILFVDSDDFIAKNTLSSLYNFAKKHDSEVVLFDHLRGRFGLKDSKPYSVDVIAKKYGENSFNIDEVPPIYYDYINVRTWAKFYRADLIKDIKFPIGIYYQDVPHWTEVYTKAKRIHYLPVPFYFYTVYREDAASMDQGKKVFDLFVSYSETQKILKKTNYFEKLKNVHYNRMGRIFISRLQTIDDDIREEFVNGIKNFDFDIDYEEFDKENFSQLEKDNIKLIKYIKEHNYDEICNHLIQIGVWNKYAYDVSIIMPVYNVEKYLERCMNSVTRQSFPQNRYEIICVNDGSTDNSLKILQDFAKVHKNIKIITTKNGGPAAARNKGIKQALGKYILFVDSDDFVALNSLEVLYNYAETHNSDVVVFDFYRDIPGTQNPKIRHQQQIASFYKDRQFNAETAEDFVYRFIPMAPWNKLYLTDLIRDIKFPTDTRFDDIPFWIDVYTSAKRINYLPFVLYYYDISRETRLTASQDKRVFDVFVTYNTSRKILEKSGYFEKFKYILYAHTVNSFINYLKAVNEDLREDFINEIKKFKIDVSVEDFLTHDFFEFEYENFKHIKFIQENDYASILEYLKNQNIF